MKHIVSQEHISLGGLGLVPQDDHVSFKIKTSGWCQICGVSVVLTAIIYDKDF